MTPVERAVLLQRAEELNKGRAFSRLQELLEPLPDELRIEEPLVGYLLAVAWRQVGRERAAREMILRLEQLAPWRTIDSVARRVRNLHGIIAVDLGELALAEKCFSEVQYSANLAGDHLLAGLAVAHLGVVHDVRCDWANALACHQRSAVHWVRVGNQFYQGLCSHNLGMTFRQLSLMDRADGHFIHAAQIFHRLGGPDEVCATEIERALLFALRGEVTFADVMISRAIQRTERLKHPRLRGEALRVLGIVQIASGRPEVAVTTLKEARRMGRRSGAKLLLAEVNEALGSAYAELGELMLARKREHVAVMIYRSIGADARAERVRAADSTLSLVRVR